MTKDHRDRYIQCLRKNRFIRKDSNDNRNLCALDLDVQVQSRIPKPTADKQLGKVHEESEQSKIPKVFRPKEKKIAENLPWKKGELLDSLDLSSTNMKKLFMNRPKLCDSPGSKVENKAEWLKENFRESINEWAPKKIEAVPEMKPTKRVISRKVLKVQDKVEEIKGVRRMSNGGKEKVFEKREVMIKVCEKKVNLSRRYEESEVSPRETESSIEIKPKCNREIANKQKSKFVNKIKAIPDRNYEFFDNELQCIIDEEARLQASLAKLDLKSLRIKYQTKIHELDQKLLNDY